MKRLLQLASLWIAILALPGLALAEIKPLPFALTISGGISLGSYEAGMNWALVEYLKTLSAALQVKNVGTVGGVPRRQPDLLAISGASAGSINAVMTAMNWCAEPGKSVKMNKKILRNKKLVLVDDVVVQSVDRNLVRDVWVDVDIDTLFPVDPDKYVNIDKDTQDTLVDGMFARNAFEVAVKNIEDMLGQKVFIAGCEVPVALLTTREEPEELSIGKVTVKNQRFVFSLKFVADVQGRGHFENFYIKDPDNTLGNVIYLPRTNATDETVDFEDLKRVIYASSAFPVAFGKVRLNYCTHAERGRTVGDKCAQNSSLYLNSADFVDGGLFDNIPLGSADVLGTAFEQQLSKQGQRPDWGAKRYFLFISPDTRRNIWESTPYPLDEKTATFGLTGVFSYLPGALTTSSDYELYTVLKNRKKWSAELVLADPPRKLVPTSRFFPITGAYLGHFGAFLDRPFREFDYYVGIYDAVINLAEITCKDQADPEGKKSCEAAAAQRIFNTLSLDKSEQATTVFMTVAGLEHPEFRKEGSPWGWIADYLPERPDTDSPIEQVMLSLHEVAAIPNEKDDKKFKAFVRRLHDNGYQGQSKLMHRIIDRYDDEVESWYAPVVGRAGNRLQKLQADECRQDDEACQRIVTGLVSVGAGKYFSYDDTLTFGPSTESREDLMFKLIPYELNTDMVSGGFSAAYLPQLRWDRMSLDLKTTPFGYNKFARDWVWFSQADLYLSWHPGWYAAYGVGPTVNYTWEYTQDYSQFNVGAAAYVELAKTLRFTAGFRSFDDDRLNRNNFYVTAGLVDLPGLFSRISRLK